MGIFMTVVATWIGFYYAVVTGWCWFYLVYVVLNPLPSKPEEAMAVWNTFQDSPWRVIAFLAVVIVAMAICWKGIRILERANAVLVPTLLCLIIGTVIWAFTLPGAGAGLKFMFTPDWRQFLNPTGWINALSQNAWDTSAGYGAVLTYSVYARSRDPAVKLGILTPIVNNTISLICGMLIFSISFSLLDKYVATPEAKLEILKNAGPASTGLTFMWLPLMYSSVGPGRILAVRIDRNALPRYHSSRFNFVFRLFSSWRYRLRLLVLCLV
jgi:neurotransmitter:Na+ symporter, NSS family